MSDKSEYSNSTVTQNNDVQDTSAFITDTPFSKDETMVQDTSESMDIESQSKRARKHVIKEDFVSFDHIDIGANEPIEDNDNLSDDEDYEIENE